MIALICLASITHQALATTGGWVTTTSLDTVQGQVVVTLPSDVRPGDTISGTVVALPSGKTDAERERNGKVLLSLRVLLGGVAASGRSWRIPSNAAPTLPLSLVAPGGQTLASGSVPVNTQMGGGAASTEHSPSDFWLPQTVQSGRPAAIRGPFDGNASNTRVGVCGSPAALIVENPRMAVFSTPSSARSAGTVALQELGCVATGPVQPLTIEAAVGQSTLLPRQTTVLSLKVSGAAGLREVPLLLECKTPAIVNLEGGPRQVVLIRPQDLRNGVFELRRTLTGVQTGSFEVSAMISPTIFFGLTWHDLKGHLNEAEMKDYLGALIQGLEAKAKDPATHPSDREVAEATIPKLQAAQALLGSTLPGLEAVKETVNNDLAKIDAIALGRTLATAALGNPLSLGVQMIRALKTLIYGIIATTKDADRKAEMQKKIGELEALEKDLAAEKDADKKKDLEKKIADKVRELAALLPD